MIYYGTIRNGHVVVEENVRLPEGAPVRIEVQSDVPESAAEPDQPLRSSGMRCGSWRARDRHFRRILSDPRSRPDFNAAARAIG